MQLVEAVPDPSVKPARALRVNTRVPPVPLAPDLSSPPTGCPGTTHTRPPSPRPHHRDAFEQDELWRYAADFKTHAGKQLGIKLTRRAPGVGDLEVYFDPAVAMEETSTFSNDVTEQLLRHARDVARPRH